MSEPNNNSTSSMNDIQEQMQSSLSSFLDVSKLATVFNNLIGVIKDQQEKINESESHIKNLYGKMQETNEKHEAAIAAAVNEALGLQASKPSPPQSARSAPTNILNDRLAELEAKFLDIRNHLFGDPDSMPPAPLSIDHILSADPKEALSALASVQNTGRKPSLTNQSAPYQNLQKELGSNFMNSVPADVPYGLEITISRPNTPFAEVKVQAVPQLPMSQLAPSASKTSSRLEPLSENGTAVPPVDDQQVVITTKPVPSISMDPVMFFNDNVPQDTRRSRAPSARVSFRDAPYPASTILVPNLVRPVSRGGEVVKPAEAGDVVIIPRRNSEPFTIEGKNDDGTYDIKTADGLVEKGVSKEALRKDFVPGVQVQLPQPGKQVALKAVVEKRNADGTYDVRFPDDHVEKGVTKEIIKPTPPTVFSTGDEIRTRVAGKGNMNSAKVLKVNDDGTVDVKFANGEIVKGLPKDSIIEAAPTLAVGDTVENIDKGMPGTIIKKNNDGTFDIKYDDGKISRGVKKNNLIPGWIIPFEGERVLNAKRGKQGIVTKRNADGTVNIKYDDLKTEENVPRSKIAAPTVPLPEGGRFEASNAGPGGVVTKLYPDGTCDVKYDDGKSAKGVFVSSLVSPQAALAIGTRVENLDTNRAGVITAVNGDGSFAVKYDDGEEEKKVPRYAIDAFIAEGSKVQNLSRGKPGSVARRNDNGTFDIRYDDGKIERGVEVASLSEDKPDLKEEDKVVNWQTGKPGVIVKRNANGTVDVKYDDGKVDKAMSVESLDPFVDFEVGDRVQSAITGKPGVVEKKNADGTFVIKFDNGRVDAAVPVKALQPDKGSFIEGDRVEDTSRGKVGTVIRKSPDGLLDIKYADGTIDRGSHIDSLNYVKPQFDVGEAIAVEKVGGIPGTVLKNNGDGTVDVKYANGEVVAGVKKFELEPANTGFAVGERVENIGPQSKRSILSAVIEKVNDDGTFDIKYADGYVEKGVKKELLQPPRPAVLAFGDKVQSRPRGKGRLLSATVQRVNGNGTVDLRYDNGLVEYALPSAKLEAAKPELKNGDQVIKDVWNSGVIQKKNSDGTFDVKLPDGKIESKVRINAIQPAKPDFTAGDRVVNVDNLSPGQVTKVNDNGTYEIKYDDGKTDNFIDKDSLTIGPIKFQPGDKVAMLRKAGDGTIVKVYDNGTFDVKRGDGAVEQNVPIASIRPAVGELFEGDRVDSATSDISGVVLRKNADGTLYVKYDNGEIDKRVPKAAVTVAKPDLFVGEAVEGRPLSLPSVGGVKPLMKGKITKLNADGTYEVAYEKAPPDKSVFRRDIRPVASFFNEGEKVDFKRPSVGTITKNNYNGTANIKLEDGKELNDVRIDTLQPKIPDFVVGDKISVYKEGPLPGTVVKVNSDGTVDIQYANGDLVRNVPPVSLRNVAPDFSVGDKVDFSNDATVEGKVAKKYEDGSIDVQLDNGRVEKKVNKTLVIPNTTFAPGQVVQTDPSGQGDWTPGVVVKAFEDGTYEIDYEAPVEKRIPVDEISSTHSTTGGNRMLPYSQVPSQVQTPVGSSQGHSSLPPRNVKKYARGDSVVANFKGNGTWLPGKIHRVGANGTYDIIFDSGVADTGVPLDHILPSASLPQHSRAHQSEPEKEAEQVQISIKLPPSVTQPGSKTFNYAAPDAKASTESAAPNSNFYIPSPSPALQAPTIVAPALAAPAPAPVPIPVNATAAAVPAYGTVQTLIPPPPVHVRRRKMNVANLTLLDPVKRFKLVKMLKQKGRFINISRRMLEDARAKYSNSSLKNKVDYLEAELKAVMANHAKLRHNIKKNHHALKDALPPNFDHMFANMGVLLNAVQSIGGPSALIHNIEASARKKDKRRKGDKQHHALADYDSDDGSPKPFFPPSVMEELNQQKALNASLSQQIEELKEKLDAQEKRLLSLPEPDSIVRYSSTDNLSDKDIAYITDKLRSTILHEYQLTTSGEMAKLKERLIDFSSDAFTRADLAKMLQPHDNSSADGIVTDPNHSRLVNLINRSVDLYYQKVELAKKQYSTISMGPSSKDLEEIAIASQKHTEQKLKKMMELVKAEIENVNAIGRSRADKLDVDIAMLQENMDSLLSNQMNLMKVSMDMETRKRESAIIKDLQKKMATYSTDKLIDDIKALQKDVREKPSATKVSEMLALVEHSFTSNIGAGMVGMRSYIEQLYKAVQHKVNREDIRALINAKISQLEHELVQKEEEMYAMASTTRCLSCGQGRAEVGLKKLHRIGEESQGDKDSLSITTNNTSNKGPIRSGSPNGSVVMDDELSVPGQSLDYGQRGSQNSRSAPSIGLQAATDEEIQNLLSGNAGLRPLLNKHTPVQMSLTVPQQLPSSSAGNKKKGEKMPDPLYLKAKLAAHMKEMVKVDPPKKQGQVYVMEDDAQSVGSSFITAPSRAATRGGVSSAGSGETLVLPAIGGAGAGAKTNTYF